MQVNKSVVNVMKVFFHYLGRGKDFGVNSVIGTLMRAGETGGSGRENTEGSSTVISYKGIT